MPDGKAYFGQAQSTSGNGDYNALDFIISQALGRLATSIPVLIKAVDLSAKTVDAQPMVNMLDGEGKAVPHGTIHGLPIFRLQGGGNAIIINPKVGDKGWACFAHSDISSVKANKAVSNPGSRRKFDWADGFYLGEVWTLNDEPTQFVEIDSDDGITITSTSAVTINAPDGVTVPKFGANGASPQDAQPLSAALPGSATNAQLATAVNALRDMAIAFGFGV